MSVHKNERGKWAVHVKYRHPDGRVSRIRETSPVQSKRGAEAHERQILQALQDGTWRKQGRVGKMLNDAEDVSPERKVVPTLSEFQERYFEIIVANDEKPGSRETKACKFRAHLLPLFGNRKLDSFTAADQITLRARFNNKDKRSAPSTYNNSATTLNSVLEMAKLDDKIVAVPYHFEMLPRVKRSKDFYEPEVFEELIAASRRLGDTTAEVALLLMGEAGLRRSEVYPLLPKHCRIAERKLMVEDAEIIIRKVRHKGDPKGRRSRVVDMTERLAEALERHGIHRRTGRVVVRPDGTPYTDRTFRKMIARVEHEAGLKVVNGKAHILRHTYCSHLAMLNVPTIAIKALAGHESMATTEGYMHLSPASRDKALELLNNRQQLLGSGRSDGANLGPRPQKQQLTS